MNEFAHERHIQTQIRLFSSSAKLREINGSAKSGSKHHRVLQLLLDQIRLLPVERPFYLTIIVESY